MSPQLTREQYLVSAMEFQSNIHFQLRNHSEFLQTLETHMVI